MLPKSTTMLEDLASVIDLVTVRPLVLLGHSMSGAIAARLVAEGLQEVAATPVSTGATAALTVSFFACSSYRTRRSSCF